MTIAEGVTGEVRRGVTEDVGQRRCDRGGETEEVRQRKCDRGCGTEEV